MNKQRFSSIVGILIVLLHLLLFVGLLVFFPGKNSPEVKIFEISLPFMATYALGVVKWVIDTQGNITSQATVGFTYIFIVSAILLTLLVLLRQI